MPNDDGEPLRREQPMPVSMPLPEEAAHARPRLHDIAALPARWEELSRQDDLEAERSQFEVSCAAMRGSAGAFRRCREELVAVLGGAPLVPLAVAAGAPGVAADPVAEGFARVRDVATALDGLRQARPGGWDDAYVRSVQALEQHLRDECRQLALMIDPHAFEVTA